MERDSSKDEMTVKELDRRFQKAVEENDDRVMEEILADDFVLITGGGKTYSRNDLLMEARSKSISYVKQEDVDQKVRIMNDTAVITAKLLAVGEENGKKFSYQIWFSDTYVRTPEGWKYFIGQSATRLPL